MLVLLQYGTYRPVGHSCLFVLPHPQQVLMEFFAQGDAEKENGLPVSAGFDRETTSLEMSQINFAGAGCGVSDDGRVHCRSLLRPDRRLRPWHG